MQVVLFLGELDCREYLAGLAPVQTLAIKANQLVDTLLGAARQLIERRRFYVVLHPVPPLLPHSARAVELFNALLCMAVRVLLGACVGTFRGSSTAGARRCRDILLMCTS